MICVRAQKKLKILVLLTLYYYFYSRLNHKSKNKDSSSGNRAIDVFDKDWNFIKSYDSILNASKDLKIGRWVIDKFLAGNTKRPYKYRFKYKDLME